MVRNLCGMQAQARHRLQHRLVPHATRGNQKRLTYLAFDVNWQEKRYKQFACRLDELCQRHRYTNAFTLYVYVCVWCVLLVCEHVNVRDLQMKAASVAAAAAVFSSLAVLSASAASYLQHTHTLAY